MSGETFQRRVEALRDSWAERRQLKDLAGAHDFESQFALLTTLYGWTDAATADIRAVYGPDLSLSLSAAPNGTHPAFALTIGDNHKVTVAMEERGQAGGSRWFVAVNAGPVGAAVVVGPERRTSQWTRARLEEVLLSILSAHERAASDSPRPATFKRLRPFGT